MKFYCRSSMASHASCTSANSGDLTAEGLRSPTSMAYKVYWPARAAIEAFVSLDRHSCSGSQSRERNRRESEKEWTRKRDRGWVRKRERWAGKRGAGDGPPEVTRVLAINYKGGLSSGREKIKGERNISAIWHNLNGQFK